MGCRIAGLDRTSYPTGTIITSTTEKRSIVLSNETTKASCELGTDTSQQGTIHLFVKEGGEWVRALDRGYGNWGYFYTSVNRVADEIEVVENSDSAVEIVMKWSAFALGANVPERNYNSALNYAQGAVNPNWDVITTLDQLTLSVRIEDKYQGVFLGWHSVPKLGPETYAMKNNTNSSNEDSAWGERELGTGSGSAVVWASSGHVSRFPAWGAKSEWTTAEATLGALANHAAWVGVDDPAYGTFAAAAYLPTQDAGYPKVQATGPWWAADIQAGTNTIRYLCMRKRIETGVWQFGPPWTTRGSLVCHNCNEWLMPNGNVFRFQVFLGAFVYPVDSTSAYINEPSVNLKNETMKRISALSWPGEPAGVWN